MPRPSEPQPRRAEHAPARVEFATAWVCAGLSTPAWNDVMPLLDVRDLYLYYTSAGRTVRAVDGISFTIEERGETIGVVGESGSGKTSLATALMRLLPKSV